MLGISSRYSVLTVIIEDVHQDCSYKLLNMVIISSPDLNIPCGRFGYVCAEEFVLATELACRKLTYPESVQLRAKVASTLKSAKLPKSNVTKEERKAIKELKKVDSILILPADKGRSTVILDKCEYEKKPRPC